MSLLRSRSRCTHPGTTAGCHSEASFPVEEAASITGPEMSWWNSQPDVSGTTCFWVAAVAEIEARRMKVERRQSRNNGVSSSKVCARSQILTRRAENCGDRGMGPALWPKRAKGWGTHPVPRAVLTGGPSPRRALLPHEARERGLAGTAEVPRVLAPDDQKMVGKSDRALFQ